MKRSAVTCRSPAAACLAVWLAATVICLGSTQVMAAPTLDDLRPLVVMKTWTEHTAEKQGNAPPREVTAEIWTAAFQRRIDETKRLDIPARDEPYYVDGPIVLPSGATLVAGGASAAAAAIRTSKGEILGLGAGGNRAGAPLPPRRQQQQDGGGGDNDNGGEGPSSSTSSSLPFGGGSRGGRGGRG
ncbi:MAG: hypothetical protein WCJ31_22005, partial [Planctomycetia bacterium]